MKKKTCRAGVADNGLIDIVCTSNVHLYYQYEEKKCAEQVLQTMVSLTLFELQMPNCNINRNEKKMCRAGVADNALIDMFWTTNAHL